MTTYKRLGDYIREVNVRNRDEKVTNLLGLSVSKEFMPSIANTIGTDMSTYKIVKKNQLVYIADTSRRGDKIAIALLKDYESAIVSQAYTVFEIIDSNKLLPKYLMMWFQLPSPSPLITHFALSTTYTPRGGLHSEPPLWCFDLRFEV